MVVYCGGLAQWHVVLDQFNSETLSRAFFLNYFFINTETKLWEHAMLAVLTLM